MITIRFERKPKEKQPTRIEREPYEKPLCIGCQWNEYPKCKGTIRPNGKFLSIDHLPPNFDCGQKYENEVKNLNNKKESLFDIIKKLENRVAELEK